jgi:predicted anti-sigma-YlaC factor YlaD
MLSCKQLVEQSSDYLDLRLPLRGRLSVRMHLAMCVNCRRFIRQMKISQAMLRRLPDAPIPELDALLEKMSSARDIQSK